ASRWLSSWAFAGGRVPRFVGLQLVYNSLPEERPMNIPFLRRLVGVAGAVALLGGAARVGMAQQGRISGSVVDQAGAPLPAARILLGATNQGAVTNSEGKYVIAGVAPGTYLVR